MVFKCILISRSVCFLEICKIFSLRVLGVVVDVWTGGLKKKKTLGALRSHRPVSWLVDTLLAGVATAQSTCIVY